MTSNPGMQTSKPTTIPAYLAAGFITASAMWFVGFLTHLPGVELSGPAVAIPLFLIFFAGPMLAARYVPKERAILIGARVGVVAGLINLLVVGMVIRGGDTEEANQLIDNVFFIALMTVGFSMIVGAVAGFVGSRIAPDCPHRTLDAQRWHARFALAAPIAALPTLLSGGIVTSTETGLAVPDWPTTFGSNMFLYPLSKMTGGIYYEHAHRLFGSLTGLTVLALFLFTVIRPSVPRKAKAVSFIALVAVIIQGIIGGVRVTGAEATEDPNILTDHAGSLALAMVHGVTGQLTFAILVALAAVLSVGWATAPKTEKSDGKLRTFSLLFLILLGVQLILGGATRHSNLSPAFMHPHTLVGIFVLVAATLAGFRAIANFKANNTLRKCGHACVHATGLQFVLGIAAMIVLLIGKDDPTNTPAEVILATAHQANGALVLGAGTLLFLWVRRLVPKQ